MWQIAIFLFFALWLALVSAALFKIYQLVKSQISKNPKPDPFKTHFSLNKFNPFSDTGGDQSFVLTLLDDHQDGFILTSLHGRGVTRFYAKKVSHGKPEQELSTEEKKALNQALKKHD